jgi:indolepyruvate ferredoxin oxidoreductase beta subunit
MHDVDILIVGVGGQGQLLASRVIGEVARRSGRDVKIAETHGMAQRGGCVVVHIRISEEVYAPLITSKGADVIIAFELLEGLRWQHFAKPEATVILNTDTIDPLDVASGKRVYPPDIVNQLQSQKYRVIEVAATNMLKQIKYPRGTNMLLLGVLATWLHDDEKKWEGAITDCVPSATVNINLAAFHLGLGLM